MSLRLTQQSVEGAVCPAGKKDVLLFDSELKGFALRVTTAGGKTFLAQYTTPTGKRRLVIGRFGTLTVQEARKRARTVLGEAASGADPYAERLAAESVAKVSQAEAAFTLGKLIDGWPVARADQGRRDSYLHIATGQLRRHLADWLERPAIAIATAEAVHRLDAIRDAAGTVAANRVLAYARSAYGWAVKRQALPRNPFAGLEAPGAETARERVLDKGEIAEVWCASAKLPAPYDAFMRVLLLTLQRRSEAAGMHWSELSADMSTWTIPSERAKNHNAHIVHLPEPAREILHARPRIKGCPHIFPGERGNPVCAFSWAKRLLDSEIGKEREKAGLEPIAPWSLHD
ncbi:MAG: integrase family protein, partial [Pseudomonadota bacterium]|nr:integrase family protein [Pseudomonadota bacterium]